MWKELGNKMECGVMGVGDGWLPACCYISSCCCQAGESEPLQPPRKAPALKELAKPDAPACLIGTIGH